MTSFRKVYGLAFHAVINVQKASLDPSECGSVLIAMFENRYCNSVMLV